MKVVDLRSELGALGLDTKGNKPALVERLRKALEAKTGKSLPETSILDTSAEDADEPATPRRAVAAPRTTRRSSSSRLAATPLKKPQEEPEPEPIKEEERHDGSERYSPELDSEPESSSKSPQRQSESPVKGNTSKPEQYDDERSQSTDEKEDEQEPMDSQESSSNQDNIKVDGSPRKEDDKEKEKSDQDQTEKMDQDEDKEDNKDDHKEDRKEDHKRNQRRELTEEEEWEELNERLKIREQERLEREKRQAEEDAKKLEEVSQNPIKLQRLKKKQEKKARWSNYYKTIETTNEILTPPVANQKYNKHKKDLQSAEPKMPEPEINDDNVTLSWYDSDLNQYLELPGLNGVVPLSEGAFSHAWAGARGTHGVCSGRVLYEIRVGAMVTTTEIVDKEQMASGLRVGWSTDDSSLHLGEGELSWAYESTGRSVNNGEFKEYGKPLNEKDVVGVYLDLESNPCKILYTLNGVELGVAYEFEKSVLGGKALFPHVLTKNLCYKVNFGYDRYNMITKTKIVRKRLEIPIEEVLEEKRRMEEEIKRQKQEAIKKDKERREKEKKEREERQKKKKEERDKQDRERKDKAAQDIKEKEKGEDEAMEVTDKDKDQSSKDVELSSKDKEQSGEESEVEKQDKPNENGEKTEDKQEVKEIKPEPMQVDGQEIENKNDEVKQEQPAGNSEVTEEEVFKGKKLDSRIKFVIRYTVEEELDGNEEACLLPGFLFMSEANLEDGPRRPPTKADCEVILMVGMPGSGKTHWARQHCAANPDKRYNILSTGALFDRMKVKSHKYINHTPHTPALCIKILLYQFD